MRNSLILDIDASINVLSPESAISRSVLYRRTSWSIGRGQPKKLCTPLNLRIVLEKTVRAHWTKRRRCKKSLNILLHCICWGCRPRTVGLMHKECVGPIPKIDLYHRLVSVLCFDTWAPAEILPEGAKPPILYKVDTFSAHSTKIDNFWVRRRRERKF